MKRIRIALAVLALAACGQQQTAAEKAKESTQVTVNSAEQDSKSEKGTQVTVDSADRPDAAKPAP